MKILAPSLLAGNHAYLGEALKEAQEDGRKWIHLDIMDGHFVPNLSFGPQTVVDLRKNSDLFFDVHLMLEQPDKYLDAVLHAGSDLISIHLEPTYDQEAALKKIKNAGVQTGMALNPDTPIEGLIPFIDQLDLVLLMTVHPGFGGQKFIESVLEKAKQVSEIRRDSKAEFLLEVDGGVGPEHIEPCMDAGVDVFVAGTSYFQANSLERQKFAEEVGEGC